MIKNETFERVSVQIPLTPEENEAMEAYLQTHAVKKGQWIRLLILAELQQQSIPMRADYTPPKTSVCLIASARKK